MIPHNDPGTKKINDEDLNNETDADERVHNEESDLPVESSEIDPDEVVHEQPDQISSDDSERDPDDLVHEADAEPLLGMSLMRGFELKVQVRNRGKVTIKRLPTR